MNSPFKDKNTFRSNFIEVQSIQKKSTPIVDSGDDEDLC